MASNSTPSKTPMAFISKVEEALRSKAADLTVAAIVALTGLAVAPVVTAAWPVIAGSLKPQLLLTLLGLSGLGNALAVIAIWKLRKPEKMRLDLGIYWDSKLQPHCPTCELPLTSYSANKKHERAPIGLPGWSCNKCGATVFLNDRDGKPCTLEAAMKVLREQMQTH